MSRGDWGKKLGPWLVGLGLLVFAVIFAGTGWYVITTSLKNGNDSQQNTAEIQAETNRYVTERCLRLNPSARYQCVADAEKAARNQEQAEADLYAQRQMAVWALAVGVSGLVSIPLTLAGIFFVWRSLNEMAAQRKISEAALRAAGESYTASQRAADAEFGAEIEITSGLIEVDVESISIELAGRNKGRTPATGLRLRAKVGYIPPGVSTHMRNRDWHASGEGAYPGLTVLAQKKFTGLSAHVLLNHIPYEHMRHIYEKHKGLEVFGTVEWTSIFGVNHTRAVYLGIGKYRKVTRGPFRGCFVALLKPKTAEAYYDEEFP